MAKFLLFFSLIVLSRFDQLVAQQPVTEQQLEKIRIKEGITGMQAVFQRGERVQYFHSGNSSVKENIIVTDTTVFQAASLSKVVLAYTFMRFYDRGIVSLDTPLYRYFDYLRIKADSNARFVTARMVLSHTSGFPNWAVGPGNPQWARSNLKTKFKPGTAWSYSGEGFVFLQKVLEELTGKLLNDIVTEEVFVPLNMQHSSFVWQPALESFMAYGHEKNGAENGRNKSATANGAASLITTANDYNKFIQALMKGEGLKAGTADSMFSKIAVPDWYGKPKIKATAHLGWGLGIGLEEDDHGKAIWHWGDNGDFKCFFVAYPARGESLVVLTNDEKGLDAMEKILQAVFGSYNFWLVKWLE